MTETTPVTTPVRKRRRPLPPYQEKPWPGFPLTFHKHRGYWFKKVGGQEWRYEVDADRSYERYKKDRVAYDAGSIDAPGPRKRYLLKDAINLYLTRQKKRHDDKDLSDVQFTKCRRELERELVKAVPAGTALTAFRALGPTDTGPAELFGKVRRRAIARGLQAAHRHITLVRAMLNHAADKKLMLPPDYGDDFDPPTQARLDRERNAADLESGDRAWSIDELRKILDAAQRMTRRRRTKQGNRLKGNPHLYAQILLGLFAGFGSDDCSAVPLLAFDSGHKVVKFPRVKNGRKRVAYLPPLVWHAIDASQMDRAEPIDDDAAPLLFLTNGGRRCNIAPKQTDGAGLLSVGRNDTIGQNFKRLLKKIGLHKPRTGFKTLRAMCRTLLMGAGVDDDLIAVVMGRRFRFRVDEYYIRGDLREKLVALGEHIERQLFPTSQTQSDQTRSRVGGAVSVAARAGRKASRRAVGR